MMASYPPVKQASIKYVTFVEADTHSKVIGYVVWFVGGLLGAHRFFYGRPVTGVIWFLTLGLLGIGWIVDAFLIPDMDQEADERYEPGQLDYNLSWVLLMLLGPFGIHRFYQGKILTGLLFLLTGGLFMVGYVYDLLTLNEQISEQNRQRGTWAALH